MGNLQDPERDTDLMQVDSFPVNGLSGTQTHSYKTGEIKDLTT